MRTSLSVSAWIIVGFAWTTSTGLAQAPAPPQSSGNAIEKTEDSFHRMTEPTSRPTNEAADLDAIRQTLAEVTQAALSPNGFDNLIDRFAAADRIRLSRSPQSITDHPALDGRIAQFQRDWQSRFNQQFKITDKNTVYGTAFASIKLGYAPEGARLASEKIPPGDVAPPAPHDEIRDRDQRIATVTIAANRVAPAIEVPMVREAMGWKIDIPDTFTLQEMHDALLGQITELELQRDAWPSDVNEASRIVTQRILMALLNVERPRSADGSKSPPAESPTEDRVLNPNAVR